MRPKTVIRLRLELENKGRFAALLQARGKECNQVDYLFL